MMNPQRIRDLLLEGTMGSTGNQLIIDFDEPEAPRALMDELIRLMDHATELDAKQAKERAAGKAWDDWRDSLVTKK